MKYFIAIALIAAVASASNYLPNDESSQIMEIINAINSPSTDPATAAMLEQMLHELLVSYKPEHPIHVGPEIIDFPVETSPVAPAPVAPVPTPVSSPLVQIIVNVQQQTETAPVTPIEEIPVDIIDVMPVLPGVDEETPVDIIDVMPVLPGVDEEIPVEPVNVAPIIVAPVVIAPEILN